MSSAAFSRLLQLASPALPIGAYSYSQGFEWAIESGDVKDKDSAEAWISAVLETYYAQFELPLLKRLYAAWQQADLQKLQQWDAIYKAGRDSAETWAESRQMGYSLLRLQNELSTWSSTHEQLLQQLVEPSFPTVYAACADNWQISLQEMLHVYAWSWLENQVSASMKAVPLGQVAGQKILMNVSERIPNLIQQAIACEDDDMSNFCPSLTSASCKHETQYSRLFRS
ncbi:hypothetical protein LCGC14_1195730 [marine sediment metagenome]